MDFEEPSGWTVIQLGEPISLPDTQVQPDNANLPADCMTPLHAFFLQLAILANHQNGRDTHVRMVKVYGQAEDPVRALLGTPLDIRTDDFRKYAIIR